MDPLAAPYRLQCVTSHLENLAVDPTSIYLLITVRVRLIAPRFVPKFHGWDTFGFAETDAKLRRYQ